MVRWGDKDIFIQTDTLEQYESDSFFYRTVQSMTSLTSRSTRTQGRVSWGRMPTYTIGKRSEKISKGKTPKMIDTTNYRRKLVKRDENMASLTANTGVIIEQHRLYCGHQWRQTPSLIRHTIQQHLHRFLNSQTLGAWRLPSEECRQGRPLPYTRFLHMHRETRLQA